MPARQLQLEAARHIAALRGGECLPGPRTEPHSQFRWRCKKGHVWRASLWGVRNTKRWCRICENSFRPACRRRKPRADHTYPARGGAESLAYGADSRFWRRDDRPRASAGTRLPCEARTGGPTSRENVGPRARTDPLTHPWGGVAEPRSSSTLMSGLDSRARCMRKSRFRRVSCDRWTSLEVASFAATMGALVVIALSGYGLFSKTGDTSTPPIKLTTEGATQPPEGEYVSSYIWVLKSWSDTRPSRRDDGPMTGTPIPSTEVEPRVEL